MCMYGQYSYYIIIRVFIIHLLGVLSIKSSQKQAILVKYFVGSVREREEKKSYSISLVP